MRSLFTGTRSGYFFRIRSPSSRRLSNDFSSLNCHLILVLKLSTQLKQYHLDFFSLVVCLFDNNNFFNSIILKATNKLNLLKETWISLNLRNTFYVLVFSLSFSIVVIFLYIMFIVFPLRILMLVTRDYDNHLLW